ncbi:F-box/kelch-repeat protein At1g57790-like [Apium graveolens]|uniref:F-box/kelch-repeat protein At1g57790-like n=1 Tax=Apium graveolens TaxID=4045 RepID=UPI003D7BC804
MFSRKTLVKKFHVFSRKVLRHGRKNKVNAKVLWSELDENLLGEIMSRLCVTDQARFGAVCKTWHSVRPVTASKLLPWFVSIKQFQFIWRSSLKYRLHEPYSSPKSRISTHKLSYSKFRTPYSSYSEFSVDVRHNWLLISACQKNCSNYFCLFSPLTKAFIQLPKLAYHLYSSSFILTFSTNPDSSDCVFLILSSGDEDKFVVMTCHQGDQEWTLRKFNNLVSGLFLAEYVNGSFFFVSKCGQLVSYNTTRGAFEIEKLDKDEDLDQLSISEMDFLLLELNGELIVLYIGFKYNHVRGDDTIFPSIPCIRKFDWPTKAWIPLRSLGDQTLFIGHRLNYALVKVGKEQARSMGVLSNAIYYYYDLGCIIYSFENGVLVQYKYNPASKGDLLQCQYDSAIRDEDYCYYLLEPPVI